METPTTVGPARGSLAHRGATAFVALAWLAMLVAAHLYVRRFASPIPFMDDLEFAPSAGRGSHIDPRWLWSLSNENRLPLPRLIYIGLLRATGDFRSGMYFQVYALGALALAMILVARRLRGRTSFADAFFPLVWLHTGNSENLLLGMQVSVVCSTALPCALLLLASVRPEPPGSARALALGFCLVALPLSGAAGVVQVPWFAAWCAAAAVAARRRSARTSAWILAGSAAATCVLAALYLQGFRVGPITDTATGDRSARDVVGTAVKFASMSLGPAAKAFWPWSAAFVLAITLGAVAMIGRVLLAQPAERLRACAFLAQIAGIVLLSASIGFGRGGLSWGAGFTNRYAIWPAPILCAGFLASCAYGSQRLGRWMPLAMFAALLAALPENTREGARLGPRRHVAASAIARDVEAGLAPPELAARHWRDFFPDRGRFEVLLGYLQRAGLAPFDQQ